MLPTLGFSCSIASWPDQYRLTMAQGKPGAGPELQAGASIPSNATASFSRLWPAAQPLPTQAAASVLRTPLIRNFWCPGFLYPTRRDVSSGPQHLTLTHARGDLQLFFPLAFHSQIGTAFFPAAGELKLTAFLSFLLTISPFTTGPDSGRLCTGVWNSDGNMIRGLWDLKVLRVEEEVLWNKNCLAFLNLKIRGLREGSKDGGLGAGASFGNLTQQTVKNHANKNVLYTSNSKEPPNLIAVILSSSLAPVAPELVGSTRDK